MTPEYLTVPIGQLVPNRWNPNQMDDEMYQKARTSIRTFGFIDPITVRSLERIDATTYSDGDKKVYLHAYEIIDGEQRWRGAQDEGLTEIDIANLGEVDDETAKQLTIIFNELHGTFDPKSMGNLLTDLVTSIPLPDLLDVLPFNQAQFEELTALPKVDWNAVAPPRPSATRNDRWVERVYRMPADAAEVVDKAVREARDLGMSDWQALQAFARTWSENI